MREMTGRFTLEQAQQSPMRCNTLLLSYCTRNMDTTNIEFYSQENDASELGILYSQQGLFCFSEFIVFIYHPNLFMFRAMRDLETERNQRQAELQSKRDELHASQNQLSTTTHHREQLERAISRGKEKSYGLRYVESHKSSQLRCCQLSIRLA